MLLYQTRNRVFRFESDSAPVFPCRCEATLVFMPKQCFGVEAGGGRTVVQYGGGRLYFNLNNGFFSFVPERPLQPLDVQIEEAGTRFITLRGADLTIEQECDSLEELEQLIEAVYYVLPSLLAVQFADPPFVERVYGQVGKVPFRWELVEAPARLRVTNHEQQEGAVIEAWKDFHKVLPLTNRRLAGALHYFQVALRLGRSGQVAGEFLSEVLLNLAKSVEVLFHPGRRDDIRAGILALGFEKEWGEKHILPTVALRNELDVGHPTLAVLSRADIQAVHAFAGQAESSFRELFDRVLARFREGSFVPPPYDDQKPSARTARIVQRLREAFPA